MALVGLGATAKGGENPIRGMWFELYSVKY